MTNSLSMSMRLWLADVGAVRRATELRRQVHRILNEQRDQLAPAAIGAIVEADQALVKALESGADGDVVQREMARLEEVANQRLLALSARVAPREHQRDCSWPSPSSSASPRSFCSSPRSRPTRWCPRFTGSHFRICAADPDEPVPGRSQRFVQYWTQASLITM